MCIKCFYSSHNWHAIFCCFIRETYLQFPWLHCNFVKIFRKNNFDSSKCYSKKTKFHDILQDRVVLILQIRLHTIRKYFFLWIIKKNMFIFVYSKEKYFVIFISENKVIFCRNSSWCYDCYFDYYCYSRTNSIKFKVYDDNEEYYTGIK